MLQTCCNHVASVATVVTQTLTGRAVRVSVTTVRALMLRRNLSGCNWSRNLVADTFSEHDFWYYGLVFGRRSPSVCPSFVFLTPFSLCMISAMCTHIFVHNLLSKPTAHLHASTQTPYGSTFAEQTRYFGCRASPSVVFVFFS